MECIYDIYFIPDIIDSKIYNAFYYAAGGMGVVLIKGDFVISGVSLHWSSTMELY